MLELPLCGAEAKGLVYFGNQVPLVTAAPWLEGAFGGMLAHPRLVPDAGQPRSIEFTCGNAESHDILTSDSEVAEWITQEEWDSLSEGLDALNRRAPDAPPTELAAIKAFSLPCPKRDRDFYRLCFDPALGHKRLVVIWGLYAKQVGDYALMGAKFDTPKHVLHLVLPPMRSPAPAQDDNELASPPPDPPLPEEQLLPPEPSGSSRTADRDKKAALLWAVPLCALLLALLVGLLAATCNRRSNGELELVIGEATTAQSLPRHAPEVGLKGQQSDLVPQHDKTLGEIFPRAPHSAGELGLETLHEAQATIDHPGTPSAPPHLEEPGRGTQVAPQPLAPEPYLPPVADVERSGAADGLPGIANDRAQAQPAMGAAVGDMIASRSAADGEYTAANPADIPDLVNIHIRPPITPPSPATQARPPNVPERGANTGREEGASGTGTAQTQQPDKMGNFGKESEMVGIQEPSPTAAQVLDARASRLPLTYKWEKLSGDVPVVQPWHRATAPEPLAAIAGHHAINRYRQVVTDKDGNLLLEQEIEWIYESQQE